jgi:hypothetical protein
MIPEPWAGVVRVALSLASAVADRLAGALP